MLRTIISTIVSILGLFAISSAQVIDGDVFLSTQTEVNAFVGTSITGNLSIQGSGIIDLSPLSTLVSIDHDLILKNNNMLTNLDGLSNLTTVGGSVIIGGHYLLFGMDISEGNGELTNIDGLNSLHSLGDDLLISRNDELTNLLGLTNLNSVSGGLTIEGNALLSTLDGLNNLSSVGSLNILGNSSLTDLNGLTNLTTLGGQLALGYNDTLTNLSGLSSLTSAGNIFISGNAMLTNLDGLNNVATVYENFELWENISLTNLDGLSNLATVGGDLYIVYNCALTNLDGLSSVTSVGSSLHVTYNDSLHAFCGLYPLFGSNGLQGVYEVTGNLENPSEQQIIDEGPCIATELVDNELLPKSPCLDQNYPNPFNPTTTLGYVLPAASEVNLTVYDLSGRVVATLTDMQHSAGRYSIQWRGIDDSGQLVSTGVYLARIDAGAYTQTIKMVYLK